MPERKKREPKEEVLHTVRHGQVVATVELRQANSGFLYESITFSRRFVARSSNKESSANCFFSHQEADLKAAIADACKFVRERANGTEAVAETPDQEASNDSDSFGVSMQTEDSPEA
jgi:hypothetical protein